MNHQITSREDFEILFRRMYTPLCRKVFRILKNQEATEDLVQDVFVRLWEKREEITIQIAIEPYLYRAVANAAFNYLKKDRGWDEFDAETHDVPEQTNSLSRLETLEASQRIQSVIDSLPPACKTVFLLSREDGLSYKEIADTLSISIKTVENQMSKALKILREKLAPYLVTITLFHFFSDFL